MPRVYMDFDRLFETITLQNAQLRAHTEQMSRTVSTPKRESNGIYIVRK